MLLLLGILCLVVGLVIGFGIIASSVDFSHPLAVAGGSAIGVAVIICAFVGGFALVGKQADNDTANWINQYTKSCEQTYHGKVYMFPSHTEMVCLTTDGKLIKEAG